MSLTIKSIHSPDAPNVRHWEPDDPEEACLLVELEIGPNEEQGTNLFQIMVATPKGLLKWARSATTPVLSDRGLLVLTTYSSQALLEWLSQTVNHCSADTWTESVSLLQKYFRWEYEDFEPEKKKVTRPKKRS